MERTNLYSYDVPDTNWHMQYYYATGPYQDSPATEPLCIAATYRGFSGGAGGGAFWSCCVPSESIKEVHSEILACEDENDLWKIKRKWHTDKQEDNATESLVAIPLIFELMVPGSRVKAYKKDRRIEGIEIHNDYEIQYDGKVYFASDFEPYVHPYWRVGDLKSRQSLVISNLEEVLIHLSRK